MKISKEEHERQVAAEFLLACDPQSDISVVSRCPDEPDVFCVHGALSGEYIELVRILDDKDLAEDRRTANKPWTFEPYRRPASGWPERDRLLDKLGKRYETKGTPVNLLLYWDWDSATPQTDNVPPPSSPFAVVAEEVLAPELQPNGHPFSRVFYFDRRTRKVLWVWRRAV